MSYLLNKPGLSSYILDAYVAAQRSKVTRKRMGSVLVGRIGGNVWHLISDGCNGVGSGADHVFEESGITLPSVIHAERNCLEKLHVVLTGEPDNDKHTHLNAYEEIVLIVMSSPCSACANMILSGPKKHGVPAVDAVLYMEAYRDQRGVQILRDAGIFCELVPVEVVDKLIRVNENINFELKVASTVGNTLLQCLSTLTMNVNNESDVESKMNIHDFSSYMHEQFMRLKVMDTDTDRLRSLRYALLSVGENLALVNDTKIHNQSVGDTGLHTFGHTFAIEKTAEGLRHAEFNPVFDIEVGNTWISIGLLADIGIGEHRLPREKIEWTPFILRSDIGNLAAVMEKASQINPISIGFSSKEH